MYSNMGTPPGWWSEVDPPEYPRCNGCRSVWLRRSNLERLGAERFPKKIWVCLQWGSFGILLNDVVILRGYIYSIIWKLLF